MEKILTMVINIPDGMMASAEDIKRFVQSQIEEATKKALDAFMHELINGKGKVNPVGISPRSK